MRRSSSDEGIAECFFDLLFGSGDGCGIGNPPVRGHRLAGPHGADFIRGVVADREDEVDLGGVRPAELIPALAAIAGGRKMRLFQLSKRVRIDNARRWLPALYAVKFGRPRKFKIASAMIDRAEFPVQRNRTL